MYYCAKRKKYYCHEDCQITFRDMDRKSWHVEVEQGGYYDSPVILRDVKCCPVCMRRFMPDGSVLIPTTWKEENNEE